MEEFTLNMIREFCDCVGADLNRVYLLPDSDYVLIIFNDEHILTDMTEIFYTGLETIFKKNGIEIDD